MAKDIIHEPVKNALIKDGWTITADPFTINMIVVKITTEEVVKWVTMSH
ncbi:element excision factor XisH family protein [Anaerolineales bacterium HSG24]|nr:element excision factor XisH family protein [Anaerolineales bacterium HSG24]